MNDDGEFVGQTSFFDEDNAPDQSEDYEDEDEKWAMVYGSERMADLAASCKYEFDADQMKVLAGLMRDLPIPPDVMTNSQHFGKVIWLKDRYNEFLVAVNKAQLLGNPVKNRFRYFRQMIKNHYEDTP